MPLRTQQEQCFLDPSHTDKRKSLQFILQVSFIDHKLRVSQKKTSLDRLQTEILLCPSLVHKFTSLHMI